MVGQAIKELSSLYTTTKKQYREISLNVIDEECKLEQAVIADVQIYFSELLKTIPKTMHVYDERIVIDLLKNTDCILPDGSKKQMDAVLISDRKIYKEAMVLDNALQNIEFFGVEQKTSNICIDTITYLCSNWKDIWTQTENQVIEELEYRIRQQLGKIKSTKEHLQVMKDWKA